MLQNKSCLDKLDNVYNSIDSRLDKLFSFSKYSGQYINTIKNNMKKDYIVEKNTFLIKGTQNYLYSYQILVSLLETETILPNLSNNSILVSQCGYRWIKIIGSNIERVNRSIDVNCYEKYCILDIADDFIDQVQKSDCVPLNHNKEAIFIFHSMPSEKICNEMKNRGIIVRTIDDLPLEKINIKLNNIVNLDVTVLITLCSEICNVQILDVNLSNNLKKYFTPLHI
jgi:hypothetical protein